MLRGPQMYLFWFIISFLLLNLQFFAVLAVVMFKA